MPNYTHVEVKKVNGDWLTCPSVTVLRLLTEEQAKQEHYEVVLPLWYQKGTRPPYLGERLGTFQGYSTLYAVAPRPAGAWGGKPTSFPA